MTLASSHWLCRFCGGPLQIDGEAMTYACTREDCGRVYLAVPSTEPIPDESGGVVGALAVGGPRILAMIHVDPEGRLRVSDVPGEPQDDLPFRLEGTSLRIDLRPLMALPDEY